MSKKFGNFYNPTNKTTVETFEGYSWPCLFLGPIWFAVKGMWVWACLSALLYCCTFCLAGLVIPFLANGMHRKFLQENGWVPCDQSAPQPSPQIPTSAPNQPVANTTFTPPLHGTNVPQPLQTSTGISAMPNASAPPMPAPVVHQNATTNSLTGASKDFADLVEEIVRKNPQATKSYSIVNVPTNANQTISSVIPSFNSMRNETILFAGMYASDFWSKFGIKKPFLFVITDKGIYYRLCAGFLGFATKGYLSFNNINSIAAEHTLTKPVYGAGSSGPEIKVNGKMLGWITNLYYLADTDEAVLIDIINQMNSTGIFLKLRA